MKAVINILLGLCVCALVYICYASIMGPIEFEQEQKFREKKVIARLMDIRKAQQEYRMRNEGKYTASFDTLIEFVKTQKIPFIMKEGVLNDKQLEEGLSERKAMAIVNKARKTGNWAEAKAAGLENFKRDTMWVAIMDTIFPKGFDADSLRYVPFGNGAQFEMATKNSTTKSGAPIYLLEVKTPYDVYLNGLDQQEVANMKDLQIKLNKYPGLMVGSLETPNNNAGNWE
ncbi:hypothetical protein [Bacteroides graminisolvens]|uniref:hypothetical protein n=1 Tax=Bacteroides graminisolvens TaxID=477666 RepID=UPI001B6347B6|nr:hypothetical protein [Bacteroides graminisolvens]MBP9496194.1 hypothetical protein [Bacteroides sp.]